MFRTSWLVMPVLFGISYVAHAEDAPQVVAPNSADAAGVVPSQSHDGDQLNTGKQTNGESWRYRKHDGKWWYWLPSNRWVVWDGNRWVDRKPRHEVAGGTAVPRRSYSYSPGAQSSRWGARRYDGFGNLQYPYSRRRSGIKQLGPVPALGGVRALPGWGGER